MRPYKEILEDMERADELVKLGLHTAEYGMNEKFKLLKELHELKQVETTSTERHK